MISHVSGGLQSESIFASCNVNPPKHSKMNPFVTAASVLGLNPDASAMCFP